MRGAPGPAKTAVGPGPSGAPDTAPGGLRERARRQIRSFGLFGLIVAGLCGSMILLGLNARDQLRDMRTAGMNVQWTASQLEVDVLRLALALREAEVAVASANAIEDQIEEVRLRFDILYSRVNAITRGAPYRALGAVPEIVDDLDRVREFVTGLAPRIDAGDATLAADLTAIREDLLDWHSVARRIVMSVLDLHSRTADDDRIAFGELMRNIALLGVGLLAILTALVLGLLRLQSRQRRAEVELREARDAALAGQRAKAEFIAVMSHEMRTPLTGTLAALDLAAADAAKVNGTGKQAQLVELARSSAEQLLDQLNDVLDIARVEAGRLDIRQRPFRARAMLRDLVTALEPLARARGNRLHLQLDPDLPEALLGDAQRIRQILQNLLGNAIKFTQHGDVTLSVRSLLPDSGADNGSDRRAAAGVVFTVADTGPGIAPEDLDRIFDDFVTLETGYERRSRGSGLGLGICQRLATAMGGRVEAESRPGQGSEFRLFLPLRAAARPEAPVQAQPATVATRPLRLLVVEDNPTNRLLLARMVRQEGHQATEAANGAEGVALARAQRFDAILMDISMPDMDGLAATAAIRERGASCGTPVYAVTAHAMPEEQARFRNAGMRVRLRKPVRLSELREVFAEIANDAVQTGAERPVDPPAPQPGTTTTAPPEVAMPAQASGGAGTTFAPGAEPAQPVVPIIDPRTCEALLGTLDPGSLSEIVARFETDSVSLLSELTALATPETAPENAGGEDRAHQIRMRAHEWRGSAATLGCRALADALGELELAAATPSTPDSAMVTRIRALPALWAATRAGLRGAAPATDAAAPAGQGPASLPVAARAAGQ